MNQARPSLIRTTCALLFVLMHGIAFAEDEAGTAAPPEPPPIPDTLKSPRATMETFLAAMKATREGNDQQIEQAITTLDLSEVNPLVRAEKGRDLAWTLQEVIDRTRIPDTERFSTRTEGKPFTFHTYESGKVEIVFKEHEGWRFSTTTVAVLPTVLDEISEKEKVEGADQAETARLPIHLRVRGMIPAQWKEQSFVLEHWQWLGIFAIILAGIVLDKLVSLLLSVFVRIWRTRFAKGSFREISDSILRPFGLMAMAFAWWALVLMLIEVFLRLTVLRKFP